MKKDYFLEFGEFFLPYEIEWRPQLISPSKQVAGLFNMQMLPYITARAIQNRLDLVMGVDGWEDHYDVIKYEDGGKIYFGMKCTLTCMFPDNNGEKRRCISRQGFAPFTNIEAIKGGESDSLKRAAYKFNIGRYLYEMPIQWVKGKAERGFGKNYTTHIDRASKKKTGIYYTEPTVAADFLPKASRAYQRSTEPNEKAKPSTEKTKEDPIRLKIKITAKKIDSNKLISPNIKEVIKELTKNILAIKGDLPKDKIEIFNLSVEAAREYYTLFNGTVIPYLKENFPKEIKQHVTELLKEHPDIVSLETYCVSIKELMDAAGDLSEAIHSPEPNDMFPEDEPPIPENMR